MTTSTMPTTSDTIDNIDNAVTRVRLAGFTFSELPPGQPSFHETSESGMPVLPEDPTLLDEEEVMRLFFAFTEWTSYAESALWVTQSDEEDLQVAANRARNAAVLKASGARTVTEQKYAAAADMKVVKAEDELYAQTCLRKCMETVYRRAERNAAAMSRELSRRGARATVDRRANKWGV